MWTGLAFNSYAQINLDVEKKTVAELVPTSDRSAALIASIEDGQWDDAKIRIPLQNGRKVLLSKESFKSLQPAERSNLVAALLHWEDQLPAYRVQVNVPEIKTQIESSWVVQNLSLNLNSFGTQTPAQDLLSRFVQNWIYRFSKVDGPNCIFSAVAALYAELEQPRYMDSAEFLGHMNRSFVRIEKPEQWGDIIRFVIPGDIHAMVYLGEDRNEPQTQIVLTKNGYRASYLSFMSLDQVKSIYTGYSGIEYYRAVKPLDLSETSTLEGRVEPQETSKAYLQWWIRKAQQK